MKALKGASNEDYTKQFSLWDKCLKDNGVDSCEKLYTKLFESIKKNPAFAKKPVHSKPKRDHNKKVKRVGRKIRKEKALKRLALLRKEKAKEAKGKDAA